MCFRLNVCAYAYPLAQNGSTSFGSAIRVELRKVIHSDVHVSGEYFINDIAD